MPNEMVRRIGEREARVNITYAGGNGDLPDPVSIDASDGDIRQWITEAVRGGGIPGIPATPNADFRDFVVDRFPPNEVRPHHLISIRPKVPFGAKSLPPRATPTQENEFLQEHGWQTHNLLENTVRHSDGRILNRNDALLVETGHEPRRTL